MVRETLEMGIATIVLVQHHQHRYCKTLHEKKIQRWNKEHISNLIHLFLSK